MKQINKSEVNPYLNARRAWNHHMAGLMRSVQIWQVTGLASLLIAATSVAGIIAIGSQSKFIPLVFQQDANGNTISVTRADKIQEASVDDLRTAAVHFIENIRLVTPDVDLQRKAVLQVYALLDGNDAAVAKVNQFYQQDRESNPFVRAATETVSVEVNSILQQSDNTWQIEWTETTRNREGELKAKPVLMKAFVTLYQNRATLDASNPTLLRNPHLILVRDFNWSKEIKSGVHS